MKKQLSLKNSFNLAWNRLNTKEKLFVIIAFLASLSFTLYGMLPTLVTGDFTVLNTSLNYHVNLWLYRNMDFGAPMAAHL
ncbi:hypothetical protein [Streptococcus sp.]|uniref:hypothetical protein n=1 Tax=Streptococcus sp. TaxID=1306 RepID=UPI0025868C75|nr:hypothetical protein [Streptococcus sp.]